MKRFSFAFVLATLLLFTGCDSEEPDDPENHEVSGTVQNVTDRGVEGATVSLQGTGGSSAQGVASFADYETTANSDGEYTFEAVEAGEYTVVIAGPGYNQISFPLTVSGDQTLDPETLVGPSNVSGVIVDSQTGQPVEGASVSFDAGGATSLEAADFVVDTNPDGTYTIEGAATGTYVCVVRIEDYFDAVIPGVDFDVGDNDLGQAVSSPGLGDAQLRIVLSWGEEPSDLDSHLSGPTGSGSRFHVYYADQTAENVNLDLDDTSSYGPETVTIENFEDGTYRYSVHNYSDQSVEGAVGIDESPARVEVYDQSGQIASYSPPDASANDGDTWRVFEVDVSGDSFSLDDGGGSTLGYFDADGSGDTDTFARPGGKAPLTQEQRDAF
jgi:hypothetical protein